MAKTKPDEPSAEPQETPQEAPAEQPQEERAAEATEVSEEPQKAPKQRNLLIPGLTVLLILLGIGEAIFWGYFGFSTYARSLARERYEQQQKVLEEERASKGITGGSSYSPNLKVENGTVIWERENWKNAGNVQPSVTSTVPRRADGMRLARYFVVKVPYLLAEMDADWELPSQSELPASAAETQTPDSEVVPTSA